MAEAVGLTLGTVALASLFTTCIECMDYFELSRDYECDYSRACLKLSLLKSRLNSWGRTLGLCDDYHAGYEKNQLHLKWHREGTVIESSLQGIVNIFGNADLLKDKYKLVPRKSRKVTQVLSGSGPVPTLGPEKVKRHFPLFRTQSVSFFRRSTIWAIRDKQRFDVFIADLDFLISNLEAVSTRKPSISHRTMDNVLDQRKVQGGDTPPQTPPQAFANVAHRPADSLSATSVQANTPPAVQTISVRQENPQGLSLATPPVFSTQHMAPQSWTAQAGLIFNSGRVEGEARALHQAPLGEVGFAPTPTGQTVSFNGGTTTGRATFIQGSLTAEQFDKFLNNRK